jgi:hypothetical protein
MMMQWCSQSMKMIPPLKNVTSPSLAHLIFTAAKEVALLQKAFGVSNVKKERSLYAQKM